ncbi:M56 family metallopeptidase [Spirosoma soli]|uniref:M56 family metallopeptidase n=1 Tax=Spirosoma soli TaxID=1770529 RepID=A0ABW5M683_9BACT
METLRYVLLANGLLAVVSIAYYVLLRRETFFEANRLALWLGLAGALVLPLLRLPDWRPQPVRKVMQRTAQVIVPKVLPASPASEPDVIITYPNGKTYRAFPNQQRTGFMWSWQTGLILLYIAGVIALLIRFGVQLGSIRRMINRSTHEQYDDFTLVRNESVASPFSFFDWVVLNPNYHAPEELEQILRHERVHVRERHSLDMVGAELVCIFFWFNPAAYLFRNLLQQTLEFSADRAVLAEGVDAQAYQYNLVKVSLSTGQPVIINRFSGPTLRQRIRMMNQQPSKSIGGLRYGLWLGLMGIMALACRHTSTEDEPVFMRQHNKLSLTNATRKLANELDGPGMPWFREASLLGDEQAKTVNGRKVLMTSFATYPKLLCLRKDKLAVKRSGDERIRIFINGQESSEKALAALSFEEVEELLVYEKWNDVAGADKYPEMYRILISTTHKTLPLTQARTKWKQYLKAAAISDHPFGVASTFSMNKLLEATFFNNKLTFVERTKDDYLKLLDEYSKDIELYINGIPVTADDIAKVHVREVDKLYANERPFEEWTGGSNQKSRFVLYIQTSPKRAKRDSSYYVFSPFYTGDF